MAHFKKAFPSRFMQVSDLDNGPIRATIKTVGTEGIGDADELKLVVKFVESEVKALVCNLTRAEAIAGITGSEDIDDWPGTTVQIVRGTTLYKGRKVGCLVVEAPSKAAAKARKGAPAPELPDDEPVDANEVGF